MTISLHAFIQTLEIQRIPASTRQLVQASLLDILGVAAGAFRNSTSQRIQQYAVSHYPATDLCSRILFDGRAVHPLGAAWAGGFCIDSLDAHEGHFTSKGHAGATVVPALLALIDAYEQQGRTISGLELLTILCIGYEAALRAGTALMATTPEYHASGAFSGIGVVCGAARLLKLDETSFRHALGIAEYFAPLCPMMRLIDHPTMLRDAHGAGAYAGINAILLACAGITGAPATTVESGLTANYWEDLGSRWEIDAQYFKPWPVCRWAQPALTAMTKLLDQHSQIRGERIDSIEVETFHESMRLQGHFPQTPDEAQYALAFPLAALIARGQVGPAEVTEEAIQAADILNVSRRIIIREARDLSDRFPEEILSRVTVTLTSGERFESTTTAAKGDPATAMTPDELSAKFHRLSAPSLPKTVRYAIEHEIAQLPTRSHCQGLFDLLYAQSVKPHTTPTAVGSAK